MLAPYVKADENDLGSASMRSIAFGFPQGLKQVVPEMKSDPYHPKRFFGVLSLVPKLNMLRYPSEFHKASIMCCRTPGASSLAWRGIGFFIGPQYDGSHLRGRQDKASPEASPVQV